MFDEESRRGFALLRDEDVALRGLGEISALRSVLARLEHQLVVDARSRAWTWTEIGEAMGASRHVARRRFPSSG